MNFKCLQCGGEEYIVKTTFMAEKNSKFKLELGTYYLKICVNCGYTEMYDAKILDKDAKFKHQY